MKKLLDTCSSSSKTTSQKINMDSDRISALPEPIQHHILSYLETKDATKTCVLSKTWNAVWNTFAILKFNHIQYGNALRSLRKRNSLNTGFKLVAQSFCDYVYRSIRHRRETETQIRTLELSVRFQGCGLRTHSPDLDSWLNDAVIDNVEKLVLYNYGNCSRVEEWRYKLPSSLFLAESVKELDLFGCRFPEQYPTGISTKKGLGLSLKILKLSRVHATEETLQRLVSNCLILEELSIELCTGFRILKIEHNLRLKTVDLYLDRNEPQVIVIERAILRCASYGGDSESVLNSIKGSSDYNVGELKLHDMDLTNELVRAVDTKFPMLEKLEVMRCDCSLLEDIRLSNVRFVELCLCECIGLRKVVVGARALKRLKHGEL